MALVDGQEEKEKLQLKIEELERRNAELTVVASGAVFEQFMAVWNKFAGAPNEAVEVVPAPVVPAALHAVVKGAAGERR